MNTCSFELLEKYILHIQEIAMINSIKVEFCLEDIWESRCSPSPTPIVQTSTISNSESYAIVLHELGHLIAPNAILDMPIFFRRRDAVIKCELKASVWAKMNSLLWDSEMEETLKRAFKTYCYQLSVKKEIFLTLQKIFIECTDIKNIFDYIEDIQLDYYNFHFPSDYLEKYYPEKVSHGSI